MALTDFLTNGQIPAGSAATSTTSQTILPDWYTNYAMQVLANQQAAAATPYSTFQGPRVAEFSPTQQQGFQMAGQAATAYQPALGQATQATQNLMGQSALGAAQPYFSSAGSLSGVSAAMPGFEQAQGTIAQGTAAGGLSAASPYLQQAAGRSTDVSAYMDPYISQVVNRAGELGARTLREQLLPEIEGRYVGAGQLGFGPRGGGAGTPSGMMTDTARALRDVDENVRAQQSQLLSQGYTQAQAAAQADASRQAQLAATAGQLGTAQQQAMLEAAGQQAAMGAQLGQLTGQQQQNLTALGAQTGALSGADIERQLGAATQLAGLGSQAQQLGLTGAGALQQVGATQQGQAQKNLDVAYADFLRQQGYPQEQINNMVATLGGIKGAVPTATATEGIVPLGYKPDYAPSTAETIGGALTGIAGLLASSPRDSAIRSFLGI